MDPNRFSSEYIESTMVTITSETLSSEDWFETKLQAKFNKSDQSFEQPEEELMDFIEQQNQESEQTEEELVTLNSKNTMTLRSYWSNQWNISQYSMKITYY